MWLRLAAAKAPRVNLDESLQRELNLNLIEAIRNEEDNSLDACRSQPRC